MHRRVFGLGLLVRLFADLPVLVTLPRFFQPWRRGEASPLFQELILGQGPKPPAAYGRMFSQASSLRFYSQFQEQSIHRPVLKLAQLLPNCTWRCLSRTYFNGDEFDDEDLWEALS